MWLHVSYKVILYNLKDHYSFRDFFKVNALGGPGSSVIIATDYELHGPGSNPVGDEIFRRPDRPWGPPSLL